MLSFFPRGVLDETLNLIESVSEDFSSYSSIVSQTGLSDAVRVKLPLGMFHGSIKGHDI